MINAQSLLVEILKTYQDHNKWNNAPFEHIKRISNTKVGEVGQDFIEALCCRMHYTCTFPINKKGARAKQNPWDIQINSIKFELKTATEDVGGAFQFNHIRYHRPYDGVICLGIAPHAIYFGIWSKSDIVTGKAGHLVSMEKGANASYKLTKKPKDIYPIVQFSHAICPFTL